MLITVSGIGAKGAMAIMGSMSVDELRRAIMFEDVKEISKANGVGKKTAERLILELKDKVGKLEVDGISAADMSGTSVSGSMSACSDSDDSRTEAIHALVALGYSKAEAFGAVAKVPEDNLTSEEYIKKALKSLF